MRNCRRARRPNRLWTAAPAAILGLIVVGCNDSSGPGVANPGEMECGGAFHYRRSDFINSAVVDNRWTPLAPGMQFIFDGLANRTGTLLPHRVVFTVTDLVKEVDGVDCVVLWDRDYNNGELQEAELAFFAQDKNGTVWLMGEYPEEFERGEFLGAPSTWLTGINGSEAGVHMLREPRVGVRYVQGWAPDVNFLDCAVIAEMGSRTCVPYNCFENVLIIDERSPFEVGSGTQRKYYAPGYGNIRIGAIEDPEAETLVLTSLLQLGPETLEEARTEALRLEARAYVEVEAYRETRPMRRRN